MTDSTLTEDDLFAQLTAESADLADEWCNNDFWVAVPVTEVRDGDVVRPMGWSSGFTTLGDIDTDCGYERLDDNHVRMMTNDGPTPTVIFGVHERVWVRR